LNGLARLSLALLSLLCFFAATARAQCAVVDLMPAFWHALAAPDPAAGVRAAVIAPHPDLYNDDYVRLPSGADWDNKLFRESNYDETHRREVTAAEHYLAANVPRYMREFRRTFSDYRCDFTFYIAPSFGAMDGSAATVNGQHRIIFAPDVIPRYHRLNEIKVLIDHETFHIYHHQATGVFGASAEATPTLEVSLWSEGLATFVSWRMNPGVSLDVALLQPDIPAGARPHISAIARDLLEHLEERNASVFAHYFEGGAQPTGYPPRAGYYVGVLIAEQLSKRYTWYQLAHLKGAALHAAISAQLQQLSATRGTATPKTP
jgi:hypothetical protein